MRVVMIKSLMLLLYLGVEPNGPCRVGRDLPESLNYVAVALVGASFAAVPVGVVAFGAVLTY